MNENFLRALEKTLGHEGVYSFDEHDRGGETFFGISRVYWPNWSGWLKVDCWIDGPVPDLTEDVREFYYNNFWCRFQGDRVAELNQAIAEELFDTAVNLDVPDAVRFLQVALNMQNQNQEIYPDLEPDGKLGKNTFNTLMSYLETQPGSLDRNAEILLNCMNGEQYIHYKNNPQHERYRGWFMRV